MLTAINALSSNSLRVMRTRTSMAFHRQHLEYLATWFQAATHTVYLSCLTPFPPGVWESHIFCKPRLASFFKRHLVSLLHYALYTCISGKPPTKKDTDRFTCRTETDSQTFKHIWLPKGTGGGGEGWTSGFGMAYAHWGKWNDWPTGNLLYSTENSTQYSGINYVGKEYEREWICVHV